MFDISKPVFGNWKIEKEIGSGAFGNVYIIKKEEFGKIYRSALKVIQIPKNQSDIIAARNEFGSEESVISYYESFVHDFSKEIDLMSQLKGVSNIVSIEDHEIMKNEDGIGWTILIKMELLIPFANYVFEKQLSIEEAIQVVSEICDALSICDSKHIIHRDIKPENIFVTEDGHFKLGDFGIARELEKTTGGLSQKGTPSYMAPEVYFGRTYNKTVDIYSIGIVLYKLLNKNRIPFLPPYPQPIRFQEREDSKKLRLSGTPIPPIPEIPEELNRIVLKACAFQPRDRYQSAADLKQDLCNFLKNPEGQPVPTPPAPPRPPYPPIPPVPPTPSKRPEKKKVGSVKTEKPVKGGLIAGTLMLLAIITFISDFISITIIDFQFNMSLVGKCDFIVVITILISFIFFAISLAMINKTRTLLPVSMTVFSLYQLFHLTQMYSKSKSYSLSQLFSGNTDMTDDVKSLLGAVSFAAVMIILLSISIVLLCKSSSEKTRLIFSIIGIVVVVVWLIIDTFVRNSIDYGTYLESIGILTVFAMLSGCDFKKT